MLYLRFVTCLSVGLFGLGLMMMTVFDALFLEWDVVADVQHWVARLSRKRRTHYVMMEEEGKVAKLATRMGQPQRSPAFPGNAPEVRLPPLPSRSLTTV